VTISPSQKLHTIITTMPKMTRMPIETNPSGVAACTAFRRHHCLGEVILFSSARLSAPARASHSSLQGVISVRDDTFTDPASRRRRRQSGRLSRVDHPLRLELGLGEAPDSPASLAVEAQLVRTAQHSKAGSQNPRASVCGLGHRLQAELDVA
jgi:hypothetical protein